MDFTNAVSRPELSTLRSSQIPKDPVSSDWWRDEKRRNFWRHRIICFFATLLAEIVEESKKNNWGQGRPDWNINWILASVSHYEVVAFRSDSSPIQKKFLLLLWHPRVEKTRPIQSNNEIIKKSFLSFIQAVGCQPPGFHKKDQNWKERKIDCRKKSVESIFGRRHRTFRLLNWPIAALVGEKSSKSLSQVTSRWKAWRLSKRYISSVFWSTLMRITEK